MDMIDGYMIKCCHQLTSVACLSSLLTSGSARLGLSALPHFPKLRLIIFVSLAAALFSLLVVFLNISHLHALLPMDYAKMVSREITCVPQKIKYIHRSKP